MPQILLSLIFLLSLFASNLAVADTEDSYKLNRWKNTPECSEIVAAVAKEFPANAPAEAAKTGRILLGKHPVKVQCFETKWWESGVFTSDEIHKMRDLAFHAAVKRVLTEVAAVLAKKDKTTDSMESNLSKTVSIVLKGDSTDTFHFQSNGEGGENNRMILHVGVSPNFGINVCRFKNVEWKILVEKNNESVNAIQNTLSDPNPLDSGGVEFLN
jgi:hypothetical protein